MQVKEVEQSCDEESKREQSGLSALSTISIELLNQAPTYLLIDSQHEMVGKSSNAV